MNRTVACLLVLALFVVSSLGSGNCTPETCTGPVTKSFNSPNCTGEPLISETAGAELGQCVVFQSGSQMWTCDAEKGLVWVVYSDSACVKPSIATSYANDVCIRTSDDQSYVRSCNVNDTFTAVSSADSSKPDLSANIVRCESANNCTEPNTGYYATYYSEASCAVDTAGFSQAFTNLTLNECYTSSYANVQTVCTKDYVITSSYQSPNGCSGKPYSTRVMTRGCSLNPQVARRDSLLSTAYVTYTCTPSPEPQVAPPSASPSSLSSGSMMLVSAALFAFIFAFF